jgi:hypothetical protein
VNRNLFDPTAIIKPADALAELAIRINAEHREALDAARASLVHARNAGTLLLEAKKQCGHGQWLPWLKAKAKFSERTAQAYMRVAKGWPELEAKAQTTADLTIEDGLKLLAAPKNSEVEEGEYQARSVFTWDADDRKKTTALWWDILASRTVLLNARGWAPPRIAEFFGKTTDEITAILDPSPPRRFRNELDGWNFFEPRDDQNIVFRHYNNQVQEIIAGILSHVYRSASYAAEGEGWPDTTQEMKVLEGHFSRRRNRLEESGELLFDLSWREGLGSVVYACAIADARAALLIEPPTDFLLRLFMSHYEAAGLGHDEDRSNDEEE